MKPDHAKQLTDAIVAAVHAYAERQHYSRREAWDRAHEIIHGQASIEQAMVDRAQREFVESMTK